MAVMPFKITLRSATIADAEDLLKWKNDPDTRRFAIRTHEEIQLTDHMHWLGKALANPNVRIYIILCEEQPCGDIRFELHSSYTEVAIKIDRAFRGKGVGAEALRQATEVHKNLRPAGQLLLAKIVYGNAASMHLFENEGYRVGGCGEGYYVCLKDCPQI